MKPRVFLQLTESNFDNTKFLILNINFNEERSDLF